MNQPAMRSCTLWLFLILLPISNSAWGAEPKVQILSPKDGNRITQDQKTILVSGKVASEAARSPNVDIFLVIDISGSTALYAGVDLGDAAQPDSLGSSGFPRPQISIGGFGLGGPSPRNLRNSILAAEVAAARRLLVQLNSQTTRVGVITFSEGARLLQPLSHDFEQVRRALDDILRSRPADVLAVVENISVVGVDYVQVVNQTMGQKATQLRLAADGFFSSAVPVVEGRNQIEVIARASDGKTGRDSITIYYQPGTQKSLELEVFLEKEKNLKLQVERLGKSQEEIQRDVERGRENSLGSSPRLPPPTEGPPR